jgi:hypothetical protein
VTAATVPVPQPLAVAAPVTIDVANMALIVRRPEAAGGSEKLLWREAHGQLVKAEELGWPASMPLLWGSAPGNYQFVPAVPGPNLTLRFVFAPGTAAAGVYATLVGAPGLSAIVTADRATRYFLNVKFLHRGLA